MQAFMPRSKTRLIRYAERLPLFSRYDLEPQIDRIYERRVELPSGGSIVIDATEALTAVDVNSGRSTRAATQEETALHTNLEAADEVARQLRLRDIGGLVVVDFIDMRAAKSQRKVEKALKDAMKADKARSTVGRISPNGLLEINRQRIQQALQLRTHRPCPTCDGVGRLASEEMVDPQPAAPHRGARRHRHPSRRSKIGLHPELADALQNSRRRELAELEDEFDIRIRSSPLPASTGPRSRSSGPAARVRRRSRVRRRPRKASCRPCGPGTSLSPSRRRTKRKRRRSKSREPGPVLRVRQARPAKPRPRPASANAAAADGSARRPDRTVPMGPPAERMTTTAPKDTTGLTAMAMKPTSPARPPLSITQTPQETKRSPLRPSSSLMEATTGTKAMRVTTTSSRPKVARRRRQQAAVRSAVDAAGAGGGAGVVAVRSRRVAEVAANRLEGSEGAVGQAPSSEALYTDVPGVDGVASAAPHSQSLRAPALMSMPPTSVGG